MYIGNILLITFSVLSSVADQGRNVIFMFTKIYKVENMTDT